MQKVYLTRRNLQTLLNKLNRNLIAGTKESECTLTKLDTQHSVYPCSDIIEVTALEDNEYYTDRAPGRVHDADVPRLSRVKVEYRVQVEYHTQVRGLKTKAWRDSINEGVDNPYASFSEAAAVAAEQEKKGLGLKYRAAVIVGTPKKYQVEYYSDLDQKWCRSINHGSQNPFNTSAEAEKALLDSEKKNTIGFLYRVVEVDS